MKQDGTDINALIKQHQGLVYYTTNMLHCSYSDEAVAVAFEALWRALETYDTSKNTCFSTYAVSCIKNAIYDLFREWKEVAENEVSLEDKVELSIPNLEDQLLTEEDYGWLYDIINNTVEGLSGKRLIIIEEWLNGTTNTTLIAKRVPCSQSYVSQTISEIKALLRKDVNNAGYCKNTPTD